MSKSDAEKTFLPQCDGRALDFIKLSAAIFMVIDHVDTIILPQPELLLTLIGRGTFPLFCYALAIAVQKIKERDMPQSEKKKALLRYFTRLVVLGCLTQPIYYFAIGNATVNVIFTLALGVVFAALATRLKLWQMYILYGLGLISMLWSLPLEFGGAGVLLPSAVLLVLRGEKRAYPALLLLLLFINMGGLLETIHHGPTPSGVIALVLIALSSVGVPWAILDAARNMRRDGRFLSRYALYIFYPGHLALLKAVGMAFFHVPLIK